MERLLISLAARSPYSWVCYESARQEQGISPIAPVNAGSRLIAMMWWASWRWERSPSVEPNRGEIHWSGESTAQARQSASENPKFPAGVAFAGSPIPISNHKPQKHETRRD